MNNKIYNILAIGLGVLVTTACSDFLDKMPDERTELNTVENVVDLLKGSYPSTNYQFICELSSDNFIDNNAPHLPSNPNDKQIENHYNYPSAARWNDEMFQFEEPLSATYSDAESHGRVWDGWYNSIAAVNAALEAIDNLAKEEGINSHEDYAQLSPRLRAAYGEALLLRAYDHFVLANIFGQAYRNEAQSAQDRSIAYVTEPETQLIKDYDRLSVKEVYDLIIKDMEEGLKYVSDSYYAAPKYHFNTNAAHAFAARVYLYHHDWDKCIAEANQVLGTNDASLLRMSMDYSIFTDCATSNDYGNKWQDPKLNNNLMLLDTYSSYSRLVFGYRYSIAGEAASEVLMVRTNSELWRSYIANPITMVSGMLFSSSQHDYGYYSCKINEQFQMLDKIAQTGYVHQIIRAFTAMDLLLERAEAYIMKNDLANASHDLQAYWNNSIETFSEKDKATFVTPGDIKLLTDDMIKSNFMRKTNCFDNWDFVSQNISSAIHITPEAVPYMNCLNDFRRFEHSFEGMRFFDLKRWGMEWTHYYGLDKKAIVMKGVDTRRALEAPSEAKLNGAGSSRPEMVTVTENDSRRGLVAPKYSQFRINANK
ncbi:RagB/SusD family nutrient uptake outer membrane protein [Prevotella sp. E13-17]|uniref:RagB/SusD family nutrient uptake outer membrane protein n=1 Tax=Prevotella sp. E13-17 TaxID=2913616 RepID=UPI001EDA2D47|nr:RagB/SusD family nutrient uptake outer membrane protein [Prevotella sp. E13-17]UKK51418.1 RagB/SusD family nutrient uptake outer membrane protein [Prevotella sp. E13-17]